MIFAKKFARKVREDPFLAFRYRVEIDGVQVSGFSEVSGLSIETHVENFREGGFNLHERQLAGPTKFSSNLVMKRGLAHADDLWSWYRKVMDGLVMRRQVAIVLMKPGSDDEKKRWVFLQACPVKWTGPQLTAGQSEIAFEAIELIHQGLAPFS